MLAMDKSSVIYNEADDMDLYVKVLIKAIGSVSGEQKDDLHGKYAMMYLLPT